MSPKAYAALDTITLKRNGQELPQDQIGALIRDYTAGRLPDYQMAAFLMAVYFQGMTPKETAALTRAMLESGKVLNLADIPGPKVDKHSTGGVGDKVSLILAPLVAACGIVNPMISGRSLAHTGGTLDKLEAIPGFSTQLNLDEFVSCLRQRGVAMIGQTPEICPADKKIYALRDATATVASLPLICGSILSKKLAEGLDGLVLDVKCGEGAIFADTASSEKLAAALVESATAFGLPTVALLTRMDQPLGNTIGTWVETAEAIAMLRGEPVPADLKDVTIALAAAMLHLGGLAPTIDEAAVLVQQKLADGSALSRFKDLVGAQGGDVRMIDSPASYPAPAFKRDIRAQKSGWIESVNARSLGQLGMRLGAGRAHKESEIDYLAGIVLEKKTGAAIREGDLLAILQSSKREITDDDCDQARSAFGISAAPPAEQPVILGMIDADGRRPWTASL